MYIWLRAEDTGHPYTRTSGMYVSDYPSVAEARTCYCCRVSVGSPVVDHDVSNHLQAFFMKGLYAAAQVVLRAISRIQALEFPRHVSL